MRSARAAPDLVSFPSGNLTLRGYLYRPRGTGPFPALSWNHGSEPDPGSADTIGEFYAAHGFVVLAPHRRGHGQSPGEHFMPGVAARARATSADPTDHQRRIIELVIELHEDHLQDTISAADWLRAQPFVDPSRMAMSGVSHGGIQTLLAAEANAAPGAYVPFAPAAMAWETSPALRERLQVAVRGASAPILLLQAKNDFSLGPSEVLGRELARKGDLSRARVYPPFGGTRHSGHGEFARTGMAVWGDDVLAFLGEVLSA
jgi:dienelactone hydrolase